MVLDYTAYHNIIDRQLHDGESQAYVESLMYCTKNCIKNKLIYSVDTSLKNIICWILFIIFIILFLIDSFKYHYAFDWKNNLTSTIFTLSIISYIILMNVLPYIICPRINDIYMTKDVFEYIVINGEKPKELSTVTTVIISILELLNVKELMSRFIFCIPQWSFIFQYMYFRFWLHNKAKKLYYEGFKQHGVFKIKFNSNVDKAFKFHIYKCLKKRNKYIDKLAYKITLPHTT